MTRTAPEGAVFSNVNWRWNHYKRRPDGKLDKEIRHRDTMETCPMCASFGLSPRDWENQPTSVAVVLCFVLLPATFAMAGWVILV